VLQALYEDAKIDEESTFITTSIWLLNVHGLFLH
jgi:hypothetical protein